MPQNQNRFRALSIELIALVILIPLALFFATKIWNKQEMPDRQISIATEATPSATPTVTISPASTTDSVIAKKIDLTGTATPRPANQKLTLEFEGPNDTVSYEISASKKITVIEAMKTAQSQGLILKTKDYGAPLGILIEGINNISNDSKNQKYWTLYVNNVRSAIGASTATVVPGDTIKWKFETTTL